MSDLKVGRIEQLTHTPGPWRVEESSHKQEFSHWIGSLSRHVMPRQSTIAGVVNAGAESDANARLLAAAPELLAALRDVLAQFDAGYFVRNTDSDGCSDWALKAGEPLRAIAAAKVAIAKAEGR
jgi:hypothetical protein